jgi:hypothetical protein
VSREEVRIAVERQWLHDDGTIADIKDDETRWFDTDEFDALGLPGLGATVWAMSERLKGFRS